MTCGQRCNNTAVFDERCRSVIGDTALCTFQRNDRANKCLRKEVSVTSGRRLFV